MQGDRGPAVEDVQKRLLVLGFDLGPTGVDGVFLGATLSAVRRFQAELGLAEDGSVGDETWAALVDATFRLGDRLLYLRFPYLHGADVRTLQGALNVLGFACGEPDGIFGAFTERAVREFQANVGLPADGIAGSDTVRAVERLGHVWRDKDPAAPAELAVAPARAAEVLRRAPFTVSCVDACGLAVGERVANLALAAEPASRVTLCVEDDSPGAGLVLRVVCGDAAAYADRMPVIALPPVGSAEGRFIAAFEASGGCTEVCVAIPVESAGREHAAQTAAVRILDGVCAVLSRDTAPVVP